MKPLISDLARKFRILADVIHSVDSGKTTIEEIKSVLALSGDLKKTEIESITRLAKEFNFIEEKHNKEFKTTKAGLAFERYVTAMNSKILKSNDQLPKIDRGTELKVCITVPPVWMKKINETFGSIIEHTLVGQRLVAEDAKKRLVIISPFIDIGIMQVSLKDIYAKGTELIIMTSDPALVKTYPSGKNFKIQKLKQMIRSRFKSGRVLFVSHGNSIAHAKVWCSDRSVLITSANVKPDSTTDNLEVGVYTDDPSLVVTMKDFLEQIVEMEGVKCLLKVLP